MPISLTQGNPTLDHSLSNAVLTSWITWWANRAYTIVTSDSLERLNRKKSGQSRSIAHTLKSQRSSGVGADGNVSRWVLPYYNCLTAILNEPGLFNLFVWMLKCPCSWLIDKVVNCLMINKFDLHKLQTKRPDLLCSVVRYDGHEKKLECRCEDSSRSRR